MTDAPDLTPEQEAVRRLLADARHDGPPPPEVVARLDETLASLAAERGPSALDPEAADDDVVADRSAPVVDLGARRRRMAGIGVLAAAAVVVAGVAVGQVLPRSTLDAGGSDSATSSDSGAGESRDFGGQSEDSGDAGADSSELAPGSAKSPAATPYAGYPTLSSADTRLDESLVELRPDAAKRSQQDLGSVEALGTCGIPGLGRGRRLLAQVDGEPGVVVFRRPDGPAQVVDVYVCGTPEPVRTLVLPAP